MISDFIGESVKRHQTFNREIDNLKRDLLLLNAKIIDLNLSKEKYKKYCDTNICRNQTNKEVVFFPYDKGIFWNINIEDTKYPDFKNLITRLLNDRMLKGIPFKIENKKIYIL